MVLLAELGAKGTVEVHQLLSGRDVARDRRGNVVHQFAAQMQNYMYVVADVSSRRCVLVDAAWDVAGVLQLVADKGWEVAACAFTHRHFDHCGGRVPRAMTGAAQDIELPGVRDFVERGIECGVGQRDAATVAKQSGLALGALRALVEGDTVVIGEHAALRVLDTPGHTPGSICLLLEAGGPGALFTGDTLFLGSCTCGDFVLVLAAVCRAGLADL
jgi:glyoxylase-like metal-dependent hydrolase (beta-lactamase superfamily II)